MSTYRRPYSVQIALGLLYASAVAGAFTIGVCAWVLLNLETFAALWIP